MTTHTNRTAIVTGAGGGIGRAACLALAARGVRLVATDINSESVEETARKVTEVGGEIITRVVDVTDSSSVAEAVRACETEFGGLDGLFNNAAYEGPLKEIAQYPLSEFRRVIDINVGGIFVGMQAAIPAMRRRGGGRIVNVASDAGMGGVPGMAAYATSKHAVFGLTRSAALEVVDDGIRINTMVPGPSKTQMLANIEERVAALGVDPSHFVRQVPVGRYGNPAEHGQAVTWLLLDAPDFMTGSALVVDGGVTAGYYTSVKPPEA